MERMHWSKAKQLAESYFAPSMKRRVSLHSTKYRRADDGLGRGWITIDGEEAWNFCTYRYYLGEQRLEGERRNAPKNLTDVSAGSDESSGGGIAKTLEAEGVMHQGYFEAAVRSYPLSSIEGLIQSDNTVHRALAMLDRRLGKRRLGAMSFADSESRLVVGLFLLRCEAEAMEWVALPSIERLLGARPLK